jgi:hypothetical protein
MKSIIRAAALVLVVGTQYPMICHAKAVVIKPKTAITKAKPIKAIAKVQQPPPQQSLPESRALINDDNLLPTQNRTQAMNLEAQTGHINPEEDQIIHQYLKNKKNQQ